MLAQETENTTLAEDAAQVILPDIYAHPDKINAILDRVRKEEPVIWVEPEGVRPLWLVTRAEELKYIESHPDEFLAAPRTTIVPIAEEEVNVKLYGKPQNPLETLPNTDGERHRKLRMLSQPLFMPNALRARQDDVGKIAESFVQKLADLQPECDFANDVAFLYPLRVINSILGLPEELDEPFLKMTQQLFAVSDDDVHDSDASAEMRRVEALEGFFDIFKPIIEERRKNPRDDVTSVLVNAKIDGQPLSEMETLGYLVIAATAGHDTTSATTAGGLLGLIQNPEQMEMLKNDHDLIPSAVEEFLRWVAPVKHFARTAVRDIELGGKTIKEGDCVAVLFASTCRDEALFENPNEFKIDRIPNNHLAFGTGPHLCLGMHLARMEVQAFYRALLPRLEEVELAGEPTYLKANVVSGLKSLPIRFKMK